MRVGVGLPSTVPGAEGQLIITWARRADEGPFSSLGVLDRLVYDSYEPLTSLAAAAAVTQRVRLATTIVIGPLHNDTRLAKVAASIDALSRGRLILGLAVGARKDDYDAAGIDYRLRGKRLSEQLATLRTLWEEGAISPQAARPRGPELLVGGLSDQGFARVARYADGYVHGGGPPRAFSRAADKALAAWNDAGRPGKPQLWAQGYFALGDEAAEAGYRYLKDYYAFTGPFAERIAAGLLTNPQAIAQFIRGYEEAGCDELVLFPTVADITQLEQLATILDGLGRRAPVTDALTTQRQ
ncbi:MAG: LLM class flavin-dependent oxidoreductase [Ktedonobacteraceae bacterium]|jgi:alkanesulfonate monooxygenase SsuD/methylene tetrahydromethanopterin reductase-like flavin-dependent oxidoreductase (luciferase family)